MSSCGRVMLGVQIGSSHDGCRAVAGALQVRLRPYGGLDGVGVVRRDKRPDEAAYIEDQRLPLAWPAGVQARPVAGFVVPQIRPRTLAAPRPTHRYPRIDR
jgi:hypothetical protein